MSFTSTISITDDGSRSISETSDRSSTISISDDRSTSVSDSADRSTTISHSSSNSITDDRSSSVSDSGDRSVTVSDSADDTISYSRTRTPISNTRTKKTDSGTRDHSNTVSQSDSRGTRSISADISATVTESLSESETADPSQSITQTLSITQTVSPPNTSTHTSTKSPTRDESLSVSVTDSESRTASAVVTESFTDSFSNSITDDKSATISSTDDRSLTATMSWSPSVDGTRDTMTISKSTTESPTGIATLSETNTADRSLSVSRSTTVDISASISQSLSDPTMSTATPESITSDGTASKVGTKSKTWFTYTWSITPRESMTLSQSDSRSHNISLSASPDVTETGNSMTHSRPTATESHSSDITMTLDTDTLSKNVSRSADTPSETPTKDISESGLSATLSYTDSKSLSFSVSAKRSMSFSFSAAHSATFSETRSKKSPSFSKSVSLTFTETPSKSAPTPSVSRTAPTGSYSDTMPLTTSALPPTTTPLPTPTRTLMTLCPPNCKQGVCSNTYPFFCVCFSTERLGFWAKEKTLEGTCDRCSPGYYSDTCNLQCPGGTCAICGGHGTCDEGVAGSGICTCFNSTASGFWSGTSCSSCIAGVFGEKCTYFCGCQRGVCDSGRYGAGTCNCAGTGYTGTKCEICDSSVSICDTTLNCLNGCSAHGTCSNFGGSARCTCFPLYGSTDCSVKCPSDPANGKLCYGHGWCNDGSFGTGQCVCNYTNFLPNNCSKCIQGWFGPTCSSPCAPNSSMPCYGHGLCDWLSPSGACTCSAGWGDTLCDKQCPTSVVGTTCSGHGTCNANTGGSCNCYATNDVQGYWAGTTCSQCDYRHWGSQCNLLCGVWPLTGGGAVCNGHGSCLSASGKCSCTGTWCGQLCEVQYDPDGVCRSCNETHLWGANCDNTCLCEHGNCSNGRAGDGSCTCDPGWAGAYCNRTCLGGAVTICSGHGSCNPLTVQCSCTPGYSGAMCNNSCPVLDCSGHGNCSDGVNGTGKCSCSAGWVFPQTGCADACTCNNGGFCQFPFLNCTCMGNFTGDQCENCKPGLAGPKCNLACGGLTNGTDCVCKVGFGGPTCDDPCAVSDLGICSGSARGVCDAVTANCSCRAGFYGPACRCSDVECQASVKNSKCNNVTGVCVCQSNRLATDPNCEACARGYWGSDCKETCNCKSHGSCDQPTGLSCTCDASIAFGYWSGSTCDVCASGYMGTNCIQKSVAVTTLSPIFISSSLINVANYWSSFDDSTELYYTGGSNTRSYIFNLTPNLPLFNNLLTNDEVCDVKTPSTFWDAGVAKQVWPDPRDNKKWLYLIEGNASCNQQVRLQGGPKNDTVYLARNTIVGPFSEDYTHISILIPDLTAFCWIPERRSNADSWQIGCRYFADNTSLSLPRTISFDSVTDIVWVRRKMQVLVVGSILTSCGFYFTDIDKLAFNEWEGQLQSQLSGQPFRMDCRVIDNAIYVDELNVVFFGAMAIQGVFLSGVDFRTNQVLQAQVVSPAQTLRCTAMIFHYKTKVGLAAFANTLIKFRSYYPNGPSNTIAILSYGQQQIGSSLVSIRSFDLFEAQRMVLAPRATFTGVQILRFLLVEVTAVNPPFADTRGGTVVNVTGNNFGAANASNPVCRFGSYTPVPAVIYSETLLGCVVPPSESAEECEINFVEVSLNNFSFTANKVSLQRPNEPTVVSATPSRVPLGTSQNILVSGRGFKDSPVITCKFFYSTLKWNSTDLIIVAGSYVDPTTVSCHIGRVSTMTSVGSGIQISIDGQLYSSTYAPFAVIGPAVTIDCSPAILKNGSLPSTTFITPIIVRTLDGNGNFLDNIDIANRTARVIIPPELLPKFTNPSNPSYPMRSGLATISGMALALPPVGETYASIRVDGFLCPFTFSITAGRLAALRIVTQPLSTGDLLLPSALLPQTTQVSLIDDGGNTISNLADVALNTTLLQIAVNFTNTSQIRAGVLNVTKTLGIITSRDTGIASFPPQILPIVFGSYYQIEFTVIDAPTPINVSTLIFSPGCPTSLFQVKGESVCRECPYTQAVCNGSDVLLAKYGYWRTDPNSLQFYACPIAQACLAASEDCADGYQGILCNDCREGYGKDFSGQCFYCGNVGADIVLVLLAIIAIFMVFATLALLYIQNCTVDWTATGKIGTTLQLFLTMLQTLSLLSFITITWPSAMYKMLSGLETFLDFRIFNFLSADCIFRRIGIDTSAIFLFYGGMIFFAVGIPVTIRPLVRRWPNIFMTPDAIAARQAYLASPLARVQFAAIEKFGSEADPMRYLKQHQPKSMLFNALQVVFFFGIQPALRSAFEVLPCVQVTNGAGFLENVMSNDVRVSCDSGSYITFKLIAIALVVAYAVVVPFLYALGAAYYRFRYFDTNYKTYLGFSACGMTDELWYWIPTILLRKIWLVVVVSFLEAPISLYFFVWSMMGFAWFAYSRRPYKNDRHIFLENVCNINVIITGNLAMTINVVSDSKITVQILQAIAFIINGSVVVLLIAEMVRQYINKTILAKPKRDNLSSMQKTLDYDEQELDVKLEEEFLENDKKFANKVKKQKPRKIFVDDDAGAGADDANMSDNQSERNVGNSEERDEFDDIDIIAGTGGVRNNNTNNTSQDDQGHAKNVNFVPSNKNATGDGDDNHNNNTSSDPAKDLIAEFAASNSATKKPKGAPTDRSSGTSHSTNKNRMAFKAWYEPTRGPPQKQEGALGALDDWFGASEYEQQDSTHNVRAVNSLAIDARNNDNNNNNDSSGADVWNDFENNKKTSNDDKIAAQMNAILNSTLGPQNKKPSAAAVTRQELDDAEMLSASMVVNRAANNNNNNNEELLITDEELSHALHDTGTTIMRERAKMKAMLNQRHGDDANNKNNNNTSNNNNQNKNSNNNKNKRTSDEEYEQQMMDIRLQQRRVAELKKGQTVSALEISRSFGIDNNSDNNNNNNSNSKTSKNWLNVERTDESGKAEKVTTENSIVAQAKKSKEQLEQERKQQENEDMSDLYVDPVTGEIRKTTKKKRENDTYTVGSLGAVNAFDW